MKKSEIFSYIKDIQVKLNAEEATLLVVDAYEQVDAVIREESFYRETPYFLSEWLIVKEQVLRKDEDSFGFLDRFLDNILYDGDTGLYDAYLAENSTQQEQG